MDILEKPATGLAAALAHHLKQEMERSKIPGLGVAVVRDGEILHLGGYGLADVEHNVPATSDSIFHSGSTGKMFAAAAVLLLVQQGRLDLDDPVRRYLNEGPESWAAMTVRQLLTMMSGLGNFGDAFAPAPIENDVVPLNLWQDHSDAQLLALASLSPLAFAPGESYRYSNTSYILASLIVARVSGKPYYTLLREQLFGPAGMASARDASWSDIVPNRAQGYSRDNGELRNRCWTAPTLLRTGDGGLFFSPRDIAHWFIELDRPQVFHPDIVEQMFEPALMRDGRPAINGYALGWQNSEVRGHRKIRHGGTWYGFRAELARFPAQKLSIAVLANIDDAQVARIAAEIAGIVDPSVAPYEPIADNALERRKADADLIRAIAARAAPRDAFTDEAWQLWSNRWFEQVIVESESDLSPVPLELIDDNGNGRRRYRLPTGRYHMHWTVDRQSDGRVSAMRFHME
ncbi:serine hydrolase domain-containing protein [Aminobacter aminovorans]|uniref:serine hydrolase domain-containing protein n=1 Tax=Aminobacter aminovorans TaxID=83263 RepID=UPI00285ABD04|nr:serine hydrolase domain-containing protein [Aminobacter aminovorans]MDR7223474.1 CubicO group peptidase (beta-lactamase class C family) [Aminobacter aminovorans]